MWSDRNSPIPEVYSVSVPKIGDVPVAKGELRNLPPNVQRFIGKWVDVCKPRAIYICDGSEDEGEKITQKLEERGILHKLKAYHNNFVCRTDPKDVARMDNNTFICTPDKFATISHTQYGVNEIFCKWISAENLNDETTKRFPNCMSGRMMYIVPFSMGPISSNLSKYGVQLTDSEYAVLCMRIMTRVSPKVFNYINSERQFVRCIHSVGLPRPHSERAIQWPCNPALAMMAYIPEERIIMSFGSGYCGNSVLGQKNFGLRLAGCMAYDEGWMAEHMVIISVTNPKSEERFITAALPSDCGKTSMAMLKPSLPGWKVRCIGDDIAWMRFDDKGILRAINPEAGFLHIAPGSSYKLSPNILEACTKNTICTNVAETEDGQFFWEDIKEKYKPDLKLINWLGEETRVGISTNIPKAHPYARLCYPIHQCPTIHPLWNDPQGVPICAILFGSRRFKGTPLVYEARSWSHGVMVGTQVRSELSHVLREIHDPMTMRAFIGYNFGKYIQHWLSMEKPGRQMPKIFHVNWFLKNKYGRFAWPGFGENIRVIEWILRRVNGDDIAIPSPFGLIPIKGSINLSGLNIDWDVLFSLSKECLLDDIEETNRFISGQLGSDLPEIISQEICKQLERLKAL